MVKSFTVLLIFFTTGQPPEALVLGVVGHERCLEQGDDEDFLKGVQVMLNDGGSYADIDHVAISCSPVTDRLSQEIQEALAN